MPTVDIDVGVALSGTFTATLVDSSGIPPTDVIRSDEDFSIMCTWYIEGGVASSLGGTWYVQAAFESVGPGDEFRSKEISVALDGRTGPGNPYTASILFPAGANFPDGGPQKVPDGQRNEPYHVMALLAYTDVAGNPGPMAAAVDLGEVTIYP